ncbi:MAG: tol-pal system protein YbgF [Zoogloeaceae bacterium]|nr:tol-pal system protein YbgF [Rhodocyclaceae bacterium]MCP5236731.1 tol-pal system protein YbgF [Zoogloeaceae bacterium]
MAATPARAALTIVMSVALAAPATAGMFDDEEARKEIIRLRDNYGARLDQLETTSRAQFELANELEALKAEIAKLRGQIEVLGYQVDSSDKRQKDFYVDLDNRLRKLENSALTTSAAARPIDPVAEARDYEGALGLLKAGKNREAGAAFEAFIANYAGSSFLPSAYFWAGNAWFQEREAARASDHYRKVAELWPDDPRAPDALLGLAQSQQAMGDNKGAKETLARILETYPDSSAAQMAKQRLGRR